MNEQVRRRAGLPSLAACAFLAFTGCRQSLPPDVFLKAYLQAAQTRQEAGGFRVSAIPLSPEYLAASQMDSTTGPEELKRIASGFQAAYYVSLRFSLAHPTGGPEDVTQDLLGRALAKGDAAYREWSALLQTGMGALVWLQDDRGERIAPMSYRFQKSMVAGGANAFLFAFPKQWKDRGVSLKNASLVIEDFGLNTGILKLPLRAIPHISLKV